MMLFHLLRHDGEKYCSVAWGVAGLLLLMQPFSVSKTDLGDCMCCTKRMAAAIAERRRYCSHPGGFVTVSAAHLYWVSC